MSIKHKLTIRQHNRLFPKRKVKFLTYYEITDDLSVHELRMNQYIRLPIRIISILLSPLAIFVGGVPAMISIIKQCWHKTVVGADTINREWFYEQIKDGDSK